MQATPLGDTRTTSALLASTTPATSHSSPGSESFGQAWKRVIGAVEAKATGQALATGAADLCSGESEKRTQTTLGSVQKIGEETKKSEVTEAVSRPSDEKNAAQSSLKVAEPDKQQVEAGPRVKAEPDTPGSRDGKAGAAKGTHGTAVAKSIDSVKSGELKTEMQPGAVGTVVTNVPDSTNAVVQEALVPANPTAKLEELPAGSSQAKQVVPPSGKASPVTATQILEAKHESAPSNAATHISAPGGRTNSELNPPTVNCVSPSAVGTSVVAVPPSTSDHPAGASTRAAARLDGTAAVGGSGGGAPQVLASGPARLDVGVFDGTHGWLRIRAELGVGGAVNASLTANAVAHDSLRAVLPQMASFLQAEAVSVSKIALHRTAAACSGSAAAEGQQNGGAQRHGAAGEQTPSGTGLLKKNLRVMETRAAERDAMDPWSGGTRATAGIGFGVAGSGSGSWLNVCA